MSNSYYSYSVVSCTTSNKTYFLVGKYASDTSKSSEYKLYVFYCSSNW